MSEKLAFLPVIVFFKLIQVITFYIYSYLILRKWENLQFLESTIFGIPV